MKKNKIKMNEAQLRNIIKESVKKALMENENYNVDDLYNGELGNRSQYPNNTMFDYLSDAEGEKAMQALNPDECCDYYRNPEYHASKKGYVDNTIDESLVENCVKNAMKKIKKAYNDYMSDGGEDETRMKNNPNQNASWLKNNKKK